ncbi:ABC transporter ATP-binding protein [Streptomyces smyrnaeus]|uniref:ABC transporter ATP-binding protein n=1 Tax=Streptomyces smyrnaeus TaxID=1387713 RepID=UPI0033B0E5E8
MPHSTPVLSVSGLTCQLPGRRLLDGIDLTVRAGESVAVTGPSGSGKSTLLSCLLGLVRPTHGQIHVAGTDIARLRRRALERHRRNTIGMVFQFGELLPELSPVENVALPALLGGVRSHTATAHARTLLRQLAVPHDAAPTHQLSGGERQRTAVARALINKPALVLADEPTGALDEDTRDDVADLLFSVPRQWGCALVTVTHDTTVAARADRALRLSHGTLEDAALRTTGV